MSPKIRQSFYFLSSAVTALVGLVVLWGGLDAGAANNLTAIIAGLAGLFGAAGPAVAGKKVGEQVKDGTLASDPTVQISNGIKQVQDQLDAAQAQANAVKEIISSGLDNVPVLGPLAADVLDRIKF